MSGKIKHQDIFVALAKTGLTQHFEYRSPIEYDASRRLEQFVELIAAKAAAAEREACAGELEALRKANEQFGIRQEWWNDRMVALEAEVLAEREACAEICDRIARRYGECPDVEPWAQGFKEGASVSAEAIRARGKQE